MSSVTSEAAWMLRSIAKAEVDEWTSVKGAITAVYRVLRKKLPNIKPSRVEDIWRGEARIIRAEEFDAIREAATLAREKAAPHEYEEVAVEIARIKRELAELEARIGPSPGSAGPVVSHPGGMDVGAGAMD